MMELNIKDYSLGIKGCCFKNQGIQINKIVEINKTRMLLICESYKERNYDDSEGKEEEKKEYVLIKQNKYYEWENE